MASTEPHGKYPRKEKAELAGNTLNRVPQERGSTDSFTAGDSETCEGDSTRGGPISRCESRGKEEAAEGEAAKGGGGEQRKICPPISRETVVGETESGDGNPTNYATKISKASVDVDSLTRSQHPQDTKEEEGNKISATDALKDMLGVHM